MAAEAFLNGTAKDPDYLQVNKARKDSFAQRRYVSEENVNFRRVTRRRSLPHIFVPSKFSNDDFEITPLPALFTPIDEDAFPAPDPLSASNSIASVNSHTPELVKREFKVVVRRMRTLAGRKKITTRRRSGVSSVPNPKKLAAPTIEETFKVDPQYAEIREVLGCSDFSIVVAGVDVTRRNDLGELPTKVAIKRLTISEGTMQNAKANCRYLHICRQLKHPNICDILDIMQILPSERTTFDHVHIVTKRMDYDLEHLLRTKPKELTDAHIRSYLYQCFCGLKYLHSANVVHRDIHPKHVLLRDNTVQLCGFDVVRALDEDETDVKQTEGFKSELLYRAPEIALGLTYGPAVDVWSMACILAELYIQNALMRAGGVIQSLDVIASTIGGPPQALVDEIGEPHTQTFLGKYVGLEGKKMAELVPKAPPECIDLLERILLWDPLERLTAEECLQHAYFESVREEEMEFEARCKLTDLHTEGMDIHGVRDLLLHEMQHFQEDRRLMNENVLGAVDECSE